MHYRRVLRSGDPGPPGPLRQRQACRVDGCDAEVDAKQLCHGHYQRLLRQNQEIETPLRGSLSSCLADGCERPIQAKGYCGAHYKRLRKHGDPQVHIPLREPGGTGHMSHGYPQVCVPPELRHLSSGATTMAEHRFIVARELGRPLRSDEHVHHINGVKSDNRPENLELWSTYHPKGQRVGDLLEFAWTIVDMYTDEFGFIREGNETNR